MAHNEFNLLKKLILLLDDPRNDIYLHVDKKAVDFDQDQFASLPNNSKLIFVKRTAISWGAYSQIWGIFSLIKLATTDFHDYYHLLSGADLPLKSQDELHAFFETNTGKEFLHFQENAMERKIFLERIKLFHFFQEQIGHSKEPDFLFFINRAMLKIQDLLGVNRIRKSDLNYQKGSTWFSITHGLANYIVSQEEYIKKHYRFTQCADEIFLHTISWNSDFRQSIVNDSLRMIDWKRGRPYIFRSEDFENLMKSDALWARKFSEGVDQPIINKIFEHFTQKKD